MQIKKTIFYVVLFAACTYIFYNCPLYFMFGIPCPGCGMTRAFISLLKFDISQAFYYHPLFPVVIVCGIVMVLIYFKKITMSPKTKNILLSILSAVFIITYFYRLFFENGIIYMDFKNSVVYKLFNGGLF